MNRKEFIYRLTKNLSLQVPVQDIHDARLYYNSLFDEAGDEGEQPLIAQLGAPADIAKEIINQNDERLQERLQKVKAKAKDWESWKLHRHSTLRGVQLFKDDLVLSKLENSRARACLLWLGLALGLCILLVLCGGIVWHIRQLYQAVIIERTYSLNQFVIGATMYLYIGNIALFALVGMMLLRHGCYAISAVALRLTKSGKEDKR